MYTIFRDDTRCYSIPAASARHALAEAFNLPIDAIGEDATYTTTMCGKMYIFRAVEAN